jgi:RHS repeat-associated protein
VPAPQRIKDANDNFTEVRTDMRGLVAGSAVEGKGAEADDFTGFAADLSDADVSNFFGDPVTFGPSLLQHATKRFVYDFSTQPVRVGTISRETHFQVTVVSGVPSKLQYRFEYSDGFGNVAMTKAQAEPGIAKQLDAGNNVIEVNTSPKLRWIGDGRTVRNNKGKVVKKYEPYFSVTHLYEDDPKLVDIGVSPTLFYDPPGRVVKTVYPDGTFSKTEIQGWLVKNYDQNDTVIDSEWYTLRTAGALAGNVRENQAAVKAAMHYDTPVVIHFDTLGRQFYTVNHNKFIDHATLLVTEKFYESYVSVDIEANPKQVADARGNTVFTYGNDILGNGAHSTGMDTGDRFVLNDCTGKQIYGWDSKNQIFHTLYDAARRPVQSKLAKGANPPIVVNQITYGEGLLNDKLLNLRGRAAKQNDQAGIVNNVSFDFKGNLLETNRTMTVGFQDDVDWSAPPPMSLEVFTTTTEYDALNRAIRTVAPHTNPATANILTPGYNEASLLETMDVNLRGAGPATNFITNIDHNEKGQRERIDYANGASTIYKYDANTFRLIGLVTARNADPQIFWDDPAKIALPGNAGKVLQFLTYTYDPVGNITFIKDAAQQAIYYDNVLIEPSCDYTYDAMYWLVESKGREHIGAHQTPDPFDAARMGNPQPGHGNQMQIYTLQYDFDDAGNMTQMKNVGNWSMAFTYEAANNQMLHAVPSGAVGTPFTYPYDAHGNVTAMPHLQTIDWDFKDRLRHTAVSAGGPISQESFYVYDSSGQRVRKVVIKGNITEDRYYLGSIEVFRRSNGGALTLERETLHVSDDKRRIAMVDTPIVKPMASNETQLIRYQYSNHLGTACLELDDAAQIISYEEYYAFGSTSYQGTDQSREIPAKRYRYTDKERDEETGFYYHGARYYAPWLARWTAADPAGMKDGLNLYSYVNENPVRLSDPSGTEGNDETETQVTHEPDPNDRTVGNTPPLRSEIGTPSTVFGNQTQSLGQGLMAGDPPALGGALSYYRGLPNPLGRPHLHFYPYIDFESNFIFSGNFGGGPPGAPLPAGGFLAQLSARVAPFPTVPNLTLGVVANTGPLGQTGTRAQQQFGEGGTIQYGGRLARGVGLGVFGQFMANESTTGPTTYSGTLTPILQWQPNDKTQLVLNPTVFASSGGNFVNQNAYGPYIGGGGLLGAQLRSHLILELGATYTAVTPLIPGTSSSELRLIGGIGYTGTLSAEDGGPNTYSLVLNPIIGIPFGATSPAVDIPAVGIMATLTVAWRLPLFQVPREMPTPDR